MLASNLTARELRLSSCKTTQFMMLHRTLVIATCCNKTVNITTCIKDLRTALKESDSPNYLKKTRACIPGTSQTTLLYTYHQWVLKKITVGNSFAGQRQYLMQNKYDHIAEGNADNVKVTELASYIQFCCIT